MNEIYKDIQGYEGKYQISNLSNENLLFDEIYEKTKDCGRVQFVKLLMTKERENKELKLQLKGTTHCFDEEEHKKLKKQLEEYKDKINRYENFEVNKTIDKLRLKHNTQQKEFIDYMNKTIEELECDDIDDEEMKGYLIQRIYIFKEILSKYKEIIGGKE